MGMVKNIAVKDIDFWLENFRHGSQLNQKSAFNELKNLKSFVALKKSIEKNGFIKNHLITVSPNTSNLARFTAYDGNRRLAALKELSETENKKQFDTVDVYVEDNKAIINQIIQLEHGSTQASKQPWGAVQKARHALSEIKQDCGSIENTPIIQALVVIEQVRGKNLNSKYPITTMVRIWDQLKDALNIVVKSPENITIGNEDALRVIIEDISDRQKINSRLLNSSSDVKEYIQAVVSGNKYQHKGRYDKWDNNTEQLLFPPEEDGNTLLLQLKTLELIDTQAYYELSETGVHERPFMLCMALRSVLDTLHKAINDKSDNKQYNLSKQTISSYINTYGSSKDMKRITGLHAMYTSITDISHNCNYQQKNYANTLNSSNLDDMHTLVAVMLAAYENK